MDLNVNKAPWEPHEVELLRRFQVSGVFHPYSCRCGATLIVETDGMHCRDCDYKQDWVYTFSADGSADRIISETREAWRSLGVERK